MAVRGEVQWPPVGSFTWPPSAIDTLHSLGMSVLAEPWWTLPLDEVHWREARLVEVRPDRVRLRWTDPLVEQPASGEWYDVDGIDLARERPGDAPQR